MKIYESSLFFNKKSKIRNGKQAYQQLGVGLDYFYRLSQESVLDCNKLKHALVDLEDYLQQLQFHKAEIGAKLQLGEACKKLLEKALRKNNITNRI